jgi:VIT1/CCC1 family predicted Fe2+/Mn2+ transporter
LGAISETSSRTLSDVANESAKDELTDYTVYTRLSSAIPASKPKLKEALSKLAEAERRHYDFWKKYSSRDVKPSSSKVTFVLFLKWIFGLTFVVKYLERHEAVVIARYKSLSGSIPESDKPVFEQMLRDEEEHEDLFMQEMQGGYVIYISFIILGLADALVEISGIHAGSLGIYKSTELAGLAGVIAGAAASIAMASAAFAQAKQGFQGSASKSAVYTGVSYFITAVILATPYFLTRVMLTALAGSLSLAVILVAFTSYYSAVISGKAFRRDFFEIAGIMFGATIALYALGSFISIVFGITV